MSNLFDLLSIIFLLIGAILVLVAGIGMLRMPDIFLRMSATTKSATLGVGAMLLGLALHFGDIGVTSRALAIFFFLLATAPVSAHMIGRAAYSDGVPLWDKTIVNELEGQYDESRRILSSGVYGQAPKNDDEAD